MKKQQQYHIIRSDKAGVFIGRIVKQTNDGIVTVTNTRRLYYWVGALDVIGIAKNGVNSSGCKFSAQLSDGDVTHIYNVLETHPISEKALQTINAVPEWKQ